MRITVLAALLLCTLAIAQDKPKIPTGRFVITGYGDVTYQDGQDSNGAFNSRFVPIFLFSLSERLHVESELEFSIDEDGEVEVELEYADIHYFLGDKTTLTAGKFLLPFGQFGPNLHPSWINNLPSGPGIYGHHGEGGITPLVPIFSDFGLGIQHVIPTGANSKFFFDIFLTNGPRLEEGHEEEAEEDDHLLNREEDDEHGEEGDVHVLPEVEFGARPGDNNSSKAFGGRIAYVWLPLLEIGSSYYSGAYDEQGELDFQALGADINLNGNHWKVRGEWIETSLDYLDAEDDHEEEAEGDHPKRRRLAKTSLAEFAEQTADRDGWYLEGTLQLSVTRKALLTPWEIVVRHARVTDEATDKLWTYGLNFRTNASSVIKFAYERSSRFDQGSQNTWLAQFSYGF